MSESSESPRLSGAEKSAMRSLLQTMPPKVFVGKNGVTAEVLKSVELAFKHEDLIKVKFSGDRKTIAAEIAQIEAGALTLCVGSVGKTAGFFRRGEEAPAPAPKGDDEDADE